MANINAPFGLRPSHTIDGKPWTGQTRRVYVPSTDAFAYYVGDVVKSAADGSLLNGASAVTLATKAGARGVAITTGDGALRGVVVGFGSALSTGQGSLAIDSDPRNLDIAYVPATKSYAYFLYIVEDPMMIYEVQTDSIANTAFNKNCDLFVAAAPTAPANLSASYAQGSTGNTGADYPLKIVGAPNIAGNSLATPGTYARIYVMINDHELRAGTAGV